MFFITLKPKQYIYIDTLKEYAKQLGFKYRFDYRLKRWELYCPNSKATKKKIESIEEYAKKIKCDTWSWYENDPKYKESVYKK